MPVTAFTILVVIALVLAIISLVKPAWPYLLSVAVLLLCVAMLIGSGR